MNPQIVLDSSCWLEIFIQSDRSSLFVPTAARPAQLIVPVITIYEVIKKIKRELGSSVASSALSLMKQGEVVEMTESLTLSALLLDLPVADSLIYATAQAYGATLWTQDQHFEGLAGVKYFPKSTDKK